MPTYIIIMVNEPIYEFIVTFICLSLSVPQAKIKPIKLGGVYLPPERHGVHRAWLTTGNLSFSFCLVIILFAVVGND